MAADALSFPGLYSRVPKPEISICGSISSQDTSSSTSSSQDSSHASCNAVSQTASHASGSAHSDAASEHSKVDHCSMDDSSDETAPMTDSNSKGRQVTESEVVKRVAAYSCETAESTDFSSEQQSNLSHDALEEHGNSLQANAESTEDIEMVYAYPECLLQGPGLQLLQLCMAMWSTKPEARPSWEAVLDWLEST